MNIYSISVKNISRNTLRSAIIILSAIFITFVVSFTLISSSLVKSTIKTMSEKFGADVIIVPKGSGVEANEFLFLKEMRTFYMDKNIYYKIKEEFGDEIDAITYQVWLVTLPALCCGVADVQVIAIDPKTDFIVKPFLEKKVELKPGTAYAGHEAWLNILGGLIETAVLYKKEFKIVDKLEKTGTGLDYALYISMDDFVKIAKENPYIKVKPNQVSVIFIKLKENVNKKEFVKKLKERFSNVEILTKSDLGRNLRKTVEGISSSIILVTLVILPLSLFVVMNLIFITVNERKKEIGILKALGASNKSIMKIFMIEKFLTIFPSILVGYIISLIVSIFLIHKYLKAYVTVINPAYLFEGFIIPAIFILIVVILSIFLSVKNVIKIETLTLLKEKE